MELFTVNQVAKRLGVTNKAIYKYIYIGKLKAIKIGANWRITEQSIKDFLIGSNL